MKFKKAGQWLTRARIKMCDWFDHDFDKVGEKTTKAAILDRLPTCLDLTILELKCHRCSTTKEVVRLDGVCKNYGVTEAGLARMAHAAVPPPPAPFTIH